MAANTGLTSSGFVPKTLEEIKGGIESKVDAVNTGFDLSPESPDGQLIGIMSAELSLAWNELGNVYHTFNPNVAYGQGLRNLGDITGIKYGEASRSNTKVNLLGVSGTVVPKGSLMSDSSGNEFYTELDATIPTEVTAISVLAGPLTITSGTINTINTVVSGWTSVTQTVDGTAGKSPETENFFRNKRNRTVMRSSTSLQEVVQGKLVDLGISQVVVVNNDTASILADGTPANAIHITVGEFDGITDAEIAEVIFKSKGLGVQTHGSTTVSVDDIHGFSHDVKFSKAVAVPVYVNITLQYLDTENAGADEDIKKAVASDINLYLSGEDVVWSRLFGLITPYGKAQVNSLTLSDDNILFNAANLLIGENEYASCLEANVVITDVT